MYLWSLCMCMEACWFSSLLTLNKGVCGCWCVPVYGQMCCLKVCQFYNATVTDSYRQTASAAMSPFFDTTSNLNFFSLWGFELRCNSKGCVWNIWECGCDCQGGLRAVSRREYGTHTSSTEEKCLWRYQTIQLKSPFVEMTCATMWTSIICCYFSVVIWVSPWYQCV